MARIRTIKPEFWESPDTAKASPLARLLYIAMWNWADDYGVGKWTEREMLGFAFPNDHDVTAADFPSLVKEVADAFSTEFYINRGRRYYRIPAWDEHQRTERRAKCKHPLPDDPDSAPDRAICSAAESVGSSAAIVGSSVAGKGTGEQGKGNRGTVSSASGTRLTDDWTPSPELLTWARAERSDLDAEKQADAFRDYWMAQPGQRGRKSDWDRTFKNWIRNARGQSSGYAPKPSQSDKFHDTLALGREVQAELDALGGFELKGIA